MWWQQDKAAFFLSMFEHFQLDAAPGSRLFRRLATNAYSSSVTSLG